MAIYYARATGNINGTIWATTPSGTASNLFSSFTNADTLVANSFTVTINVNTTVLEIRNDTTGGATNGGGFTLNSTVTLNANCISGTIALLTYNGGIGATASIIGNITSNGGNAVTFSNGAVGTLNITGSVNGVSGTALNINGGTVINVNGNITASAGRGFYMINSLPTINITGNIIGGSSAGFDSFHGSVVTGGSITITGNITGGSSGGIGMAIGSNLSTTATIIGSVTGGTGAVGMTIGVLSSSSVTVTRAKGNGFGIGSVGLTSNVGVAKNSQSSTVRVYEIEYGDLGQSPTSGPIQIFDASTNVCLIYRTGLSKKTLVDASASSGAFPSNSDVRSGISFNNGNNTGTMAVPSASSVANGVGVDNTTGTAVLTPANVWDYLTSNISTSGSIGERLKNCSTIASVGQQLSNSLSGQ